jgi:hypothetical protein
MLGERWGLPWITPESVVGCMGRAPTPAQLGSDRVEAKLLKDWMFFERRIELAVIARSGRLWARVATHVYNELGAIGLTKREAQA